MQIVTKGGNVYDTDKIWVDVMDDYGIKIPVLLFRDNREATFSRTSLRQEEVAVIIE